MRNNTTTFAPHTQRFAGAVPITDFAFGDAVVAESGRVEINVLNYPRITLTDPSLTHQRWSHSGNPSVDIISLASQATSLSNPAASPLAHISLAFQARVVNQELVPTIMMFGGGAEEGKAGMGLSTTAPDGLQVPFNGLIQTFYQMDPNRSNGQHAVVSVEEGSFIGIYSKASFGDMILTYVIAEMSPNVNDETLTGLPEEAAGRTMFYANLRLVGVTYGPRKGKRMTHLPKADASIYAATKLAHTAFEQFSSRPQWGVSYAITCMQAKNDNPLPSLEGHIPNVVYDADGTTAELKNLRVMQDDVLGNVAENTGMIGRFRRAGLENSQKPNDPAYSGIVRVGIKVERTDEKWKVTIGLLSKDRKVLMANPVLIKTGHDADLDYILGFFEIDAQIEDILEADGGEFYAISKD